MSSTSPTAGPYTVVYSEEKSAFRIKGPTPHNWNYSEARSAQEQADQLNAAYRAGQESREQQWISASEAVAGGYLVEREFAEDGPRGGQVTFDVAYRDRHGNWTLGNSRMNAALILRCFPIPPQNR